MLNPASSLLTQSYGTADRTQPRHNYKEETNLPVTDNPYETAVQGAVPGASKAEQNGAQKSGQDGKKNFDSYECQTCKNRKYTDGSNDPGVSYKTPTAISPEKASTAVRAHEYEHVHRERAAASREGREVVSQSVSYQSATCPECGRVYTAGGTTRTVTRAQVENTYGLSSEAEKGQNLNLTA